MSVYAHVYTLPKILRKFKSQIFLPLSQAFHIFLKITLKIKNHIVYCFFFVSPHPKLLTTYIHFSITGIAKVGPIILEIPQIP